MTTTYAGSFKDLQVYQKTREVSRTVFRRSACSIGAQIAEAWGKRRYDKHFVSKLTDADAEQMETQHWGGEARDCGYLAPADASQLNSRLEEIGRMLNSMIEKADSFCGPPDGVLREQATEYFTTTALMTDNR